jgi:hypothetical protein
MPAEKDDRTERLRGLLRTHEELKETDRANLCLAALSFQSVRYPNRHVWVDTDIDGGFVIDLEDWEYDETWDNSVAHLMTTNIEACSMIIIAWLSGNTLDLCRQLCKEGGGEVGHDGLGEGTWGHGT